MSDESAYPNTAVPSWSGFVYQGKVAVYHVLKLLAEATDYSNHVLQLDSLEDFAILNSEGSVISLHQVKAKKSQHYSSYENAFKKLKEKEVSGGPEKFFHSAKEITDKTKQEIESENSPVKVYEYEGNSYCPVGGDDGINNKIEAIIKMLLASLWENDDSKRSDEYACKTRSYFDQLISKQLFKIHQIIHDNLTSETKAAYTQTIKFSDFLEILKKDLNQNKLGQDYYFYVLLADFHRYYQEYCIDNEDHIDEDGLKKLSYCMLKIENLEKDQMVKFICNIMPHRKVSFNTLKDYKENTFNGIEIKRAFLKILHALKEPKFKTKCFFEWSIERKSYVPTAINDGGSQSEDICIDIVKNGLDTDLEVLFEGDFLITTDIEVPSIIDKAPDSMKIAKTDHNRLLLGKKISLIKLSNAREIINV